MRRQLSEKASGWFAEPVGVCWGGVAGYRRPREPPFVTCSRLDPIGWPRDQGPGLGLCVSDGKLGLPLDINVFLITQSSLARQKQRKEGCWCGDCGQRPCLFGRACLRWRVSRDEEMSNHLSVKQLPRRLVLRGAVEVLVWVVEKAL